MEKKDKTVIILFNTEPSKPVKKLGMQYIENPVSNTTTALFHWKAHPCLG